MQVEITVKVNGQLVKLGWLVTERTWVGRQVLTHTACNTMGYAVSGIAPSGTSRCSSHATKAGDNAALARIQDRLSPAKHDR